MEICMQYDRNVLVMLGMRKEDVHKWKIYDLANRLAVCGPLSEPGGPVSAIFEKILGLSPLCGLCRVRAIKDAVPAWQSSMRSDE